MACDMLCCWRTEQSQGWQVVVCITSRYTPHGVLRGSCCCASLHVDCSGDAHLSSSAFTVRCMHQAGCASPAAGYLCDTPALGQPYACSRLPCVQCTAAFAYMTLPASIALHTMFHRHKCQLPFHEYRAQCGAVRLKAAVPFASRPRKRAESLVVPPSCTLAQTPFSPARHRHTHTHTRTRARSNGSVTSAG